MGKRPALRDHMATMIMERAASVLAEHGDAVSMTEIAKATDVGRATVYRYFPTREALFAAMADAALEDLGARVKEAGLHNVAVTEAIARITRAFIGSGQYATLLLQQRDGGVSSTKIEQHITGPIRALLQRGIDSSVLRGDMSTDAMLTIFAGLLQAGITLAASLGGEQASAAVTAVLLDGVSAGADGPKS